MNDNPFNEVIHKTKWVEEAKKRSILEGKLLKTKLPKKYEQEEKRHDKVEEAEEAKHEKRHDKAMIKAIKSKKKPCKGK